MIFAVLGIWTDKPQKWGAGADAEGRRNSTLRSCCFLWTIPWTHEEMAINKHSITISYYSQVFWISNQNLETGYFDSFRLSVYLRALTTIFVHVFLGCEFFSVFFCSQEDNTGELKMCLNSEVVSNSPKSRSGRFWGEQQVLQDMKESNGKPSRTLHGSAEVGRLDSTVGQSWTRVFQECEHLIMFVNNFPIFAFPSF